MIEVTNGGQVITSAFQWIAIAGAGLFALFIIWAAAFAVWDHYRGRTTRSIPDPLDEYSDAIDSDEILADKRREDD